MKYFIEKKYLRLYKQHKKGKVTAEAFVEACQSFHYTDKKGHLHRLSPQGSWNVYLKGRWEFDSYLTGAHKGKLNVLAGYRKPKILMKLLSVVLIITVLTTFVFPGIINNTRERLTAYLNQPKPYVSPQIEQELVPGITLLATNGAVNEGQTFSGYEVDLGTASVQMARNGVASIPLYAFEFDAGLNEGESFRKPVALNIDLAKVPIPQEGWDELVVDRIGADGTVERLNTDINNGELIIYANSNSLIVIGGLITLVGLIGYATNREITDKYGDAYMDYVSVKVPDSKYSQYKILFNPNSIGYPSEIKNRHAKYTAIMQKYNLIWSNERRMYVLPEIQNLPATKAMDNATRAKMSAILQKLYKDPEYIKLKEEVKIEAIPTKVAHVIEALKTAHDYLYDVRQFKRVDDIDIIIQDGASWKGGNAEAMYIDNFLNWPYIGVNLQKTDESDELVVTMTHEMFHAIQKQYKGVGSASDGAIELQYDEALAIMLEAEAADYFIRQKVIKAYDNKAEKVQYSALLAYAWPDNKDQVKANGEVDKEKNYQSYGYGIGYVLETEKAAFKGDKNDFILNKLLTMSNLGLIDCIYKGYAKNLMYEHAKSADGLLALNTIKVNNETLNRPDKEVLIDVEDRPLSYAAYAYQLESSLFPDRQSLDRAVIIHYMSLSSSTSMESHEKKLLYNLKQETNKVSFDKLDNDFGFHILPVTTSSVVVGSNRVYNFYMTDDKKDDRKATNDALRTFVAVPPAGPVDIQYDEDKTAFMIELEHQLTNGTNLNKGRVVELTVPNTSIKPLRVYFDKNEYKKEVPLMDLLLSEGYATESVGDKAMGAMVTGLLETNIRLVVGQFAAATDGLLIAYWDSSKDAMNLRVNEKYKNEQAPEGYQVPYQLLKQLNVPTSVEISAETDNKQVQVKLDAEKRVHVNVSYSLNDLFRYLRYTMIRAGTVGVDYEKVQKRLKELDDHGEVHCDVRHVYSEEEDEKTYLYADKCETIYNQSTPLAVLGPVSSEMIYRSPFIGTLPMAVAAGTYRSTSFFRITTNMDSAIPSMMHDSKDKRYQIKHDSEMKAYLENNADMLNRLRAEKGEAAVQERINAEEADIREDFQRSEEDFDSNFKTEFNKMLDEFNRMEYILKTPANMTGEASLTIRSGTGNRSSDNDVVYKASVVPGSSTGRYIFTIPNEEPMDLVITPNGDIIIEGVPGIFKK